MTPEQHEARAKQLRRRRTKLCRELASQHDLVAKLQRSRAQKANPST